MWCWWAAMGHLLSLRKGKEWVFGQAVLNQARKPSPRRADCLRRLPLPLRRSIHPNSNSTHHHTITATTTMPEADLRRRMQDQRAAIDRRIADARQRATAAAAAFSAAILSARSIANQTVSNRAQLNELKQQLRKLEADLAQTLSVQTIKRSKHKLMGDSILNTTATNEHLRSLLMDQKAKRDEYANAISNQLQAIESLEAESDAKGDKNLEKAIMWYNMLLGFQVVGGEGVKFVFSKIDVQNPDKEYSFCIKLIEQRYILIQCVPFVDGSKELVKDLNCNNDLYKFVRIMRERFQAATANGNLLASSFCPDMPSIITSSLSALSLDSRSENSTNQSYTESRPKNQEIPTKKGSTSRSATSSPSTRLCSMRHSPQIIERC